MVFQKLTKDLYGDIKMIIIHNIKAKNNFYWAGNPPDMLLITKSTFNLLHYIIRINALFFA